MTTIALVNLRMKACNLSGRGGSSMARLLQGRRTLTSLVARSHLRSCSRAPLSCNQSHHNNLPHHHNISNNFINQSLPMTGLSFCRYQSNIPNNDEFIQDQAATANSVESSMSTPISTSDLLSDAAFHVNDTHVGQTLADLGLGGYTPIGLLQHAIDSLHSYVGLPWWGSIMVATAILRALTLPLVVRSYRNSARMNNISPTVSRLMNKMRAAPTQQEAALYSQELRLLFQKHNCNPFKSLISPLLQVPVFISFFLGLRRMCTAPLESMKDGGMYWFTDLTAADPYYVLPVLSCVTMLLTLELGTEVGARNSGMQQQATMKVMKIVFRFLAIGMLPVTAQFPTAIFCYWLTSNSCSMLQMVILNTPRIRKSFGIPELIKVEPPPEESKDKGIASNFKTAYNAAKQRTVVEQQRKSREKAYKQALNVSAQDLVKQNPRHKKKKNKR